MNWTELTIYTSTDGISHVTGALMQLGITGFAIEDPADFEAFLEGTTTHWDYVDEKLMEKRHAETNVKIYLPDNAQGRELYLLVTGALARLRADDDAGILGRLETADLAVREEDWADSWKQYFKPFTVGDRLLVKPSWEELPAGSDGRAVLEIDPGQAFGTGQHETTRLCMELLEGCVTQGCRLLDLGTGSGILSVAALLLGASAATGTDIDENALKTARENAALNGIGPDRFETIAGDAANNTGLAKKLSEHPADVITANIVADVLIAYAPLFDGFLAQGGTLIVSGIIDERAHEVTDAIEAQGFIKMQALSHGGWTAVRFARSPSLNK